VEEDPEGAAERGRKEGGAGSVGEGQDEGRVMRF
jgi:hypothetical protein